MARTLRGGLRLRMCPTKKHEGCNIGRPRCLLAAVPTNSLRHLVGGLQWGVAFEAKPQKPP